MASPFPDAASQPAASTPVTQQDSFTTQGPGTTVVAPSQTQTRRADELARKDRTLAEFMLMLDDYEPLIPEEVTDYYLQRAGFDCEDPRLKRLLSLAAQKFVADMASDAFQHARIRTNAQPAARRQAGTDKAPGTSGPSTSIKDKTKTVLTMEDLSAALNEYGINARKQEYYL